MKRIEVKLLFWAIVFLSACMQCKCKPVEYSKYKKDKKGFYRRELHDGDTIVILNTH